ncbi:MAG: J domain-containing protein [Clostridiales bacterium]|nr:J domain-containing protein [Clostridiales bacterium]
MNAFEVLGLSADANEQQIRRAYHARVKRCHPDQFTDAEMQRKAQEELTELNLAYEEALKRALTMKPTVYRRVPPAEAKATARRLLSQDRYESALLQLGRAENRDDEWYYIQGLILMGMKQFGSAHQSFREAIRLQPDNNDYRTGALEAAVALKKRQHWAYRMADWADGIIHSRKKP